MAVVGSYGALGRTSVTSPPPPGGKGKSGTCWIYTVFEFGFESGFGGGEDLFFPNRLILLVVILF